MRHLASECLLLILLAGLLGCERGADDGSDWDEPGSQGLTKQDLEDLYESAPELQARWQKLNQESPEVARRARGLVEGLSSGGGEVDFAAASVYERKPTDPALSQRTALWLGLGLIGVTLLVAATVYCIRGLRDGFGVYERSEKRMRRQYFDKCEREREKRSRGLWVP